MVVNILQKHRHKIILGAPVLFLFFVSGGTDLGASGYVFDVSGTPFMKVGESRDISVLVDTKSPVNAVGGTILFPNDKITVDQTSSDASIVELWADPPGASQDGGYIHFSGGFTHDNGYTGRGKIFSMKLRAAAPGVAEVRANDMELLADDGIGTNIASSRSRKLRLFISDDAHPSPDINGDNELSLMDASVLYLETFRTYDPRYDLNGDGKIDWGDVRYLLSIINQ